MIRILEKNIADKIAAGEVIDRPVSIVKELVENSIDAGASMITIEIHNGGKSYIRVTDNGCGIEDDQVELAFKRHATSKIINEKDLDSIETLGFRGEALASIAAVSRVELITKTSGAKTGRRVLTEGSEILENTAIGCPDGTTITVKDLFYNVPARQKFMSADASEARQIIDFASRIALSYPDVRFNVINGNKRAFTTAGKGNIKASIVNIYGADIGKDLIPVEKTSSGYTLKGYISSPGTSMSTRSRQIFCVNGRIISSSVLEHALDKAYKDRLFHGRFPIAFLFLAMPAEKLDVNIHPTKKEVRFDDNAEVEDFVQEAVIQSLQGKEGIPAVHGETLHAVHDDDFKYGSSESESLEISEKIQKEDDDSTQVDINNLLQTIRSESDNRLNYEIKKSEEINFIETISNKPFDFDKLSIIGVVFNTYIAAQDNDCFYLIDQHAAHERLFYERLMKQYNSSEKASQQLLIPLNFHVSSDVSSTESVWIEKVTAMGYDIEFFGNNTYIVREIPAFMEMKEAEDFLNDLFNEFSERPDLSNISILDKIIIRSCKSAIKAGDFLTPEEIDSLLAQLKTCDNPFSCPHGRPTFIKMTKYEIERMFKRV